MVSSKYSNNNNINTVMPLVIDALGTIPKSLIRGLDKSWKSKNKQRPSKLQHP